MHSHWGDWVHFDYDQINDTANEPSMTQFGHFSAKYTLFYTQFSSIFTLSQTELLNVDLFSVFWLATWAGNMDLYYRYGISPVEKKAKRSKTSASEASPAVDWGGGNRPFSSPDFLSAPGRFFFLFFPHCEPDLRLGFPALVPQKSSLFGHIINPSLTSLFGQDGWTLASSLIPTLSRSIKQQKRTWPMTSYLDLRLDQ